MNKSENRNEMIVTYMYDIKNNDEAAFSGGYLYY